MTVPIPSAAAVSKSALYPVGSSRDAGRERGTSQRAGAWGDGNGDGGVCREQPTYLDAHKPQCVPTVCLYMCI